jgi:hypothetical protein
MPIALHHLCEPERGVRKAVQSKRHYTLAIKDFNFVQW